MEIKRDRYLKQLIEFALDGQIKVITGIRRSGKSYLLNILYKDYLMKHGVLEEQIIIIELDKTRDLKFRNPLELSSYIRQFINGKTNQFYLFIDEIHMSDELLNPYNPSGKKITIYELLNDLKDIENLDVYVTGSNSKMLSSDILTEFRGRSDEIKIHPLSFEEYYSAHQGDKNEAFEQYAFYGGMPLIISKKSDESKMTYLKSLFNEVYLKDIIERNHIINEDLFSVILDLLCSSIGSLTNPNKIMKTIKSKMHINTTQVTIKKYLNYLEDEFLFMESKRYDVKGKSYFDYPSKYYCQDLGLRNARIGFREQELNHIMENIIFNELIYRGYTVDVGVVYGKEVNSHQTIVNAPHEIDFIATKGFKKIYIQSAFEMTNEEKRLTEIRPFLLTSDSFPKIIVRKDISQRWYDDNGILNIGVVDFLLDQNLF